MVVVVGGGGGGGGYWGSHRWRVLSGEGIYFRTLPRLHPMKDCITWPRNFL